MILLNVAAQAPRACVLSQTPSGGLELVILSPWLSPAMSHSFFNRSEYVNNTDLTPGAFRRVRLVASGHGKRPELAEVKRSAIRPRVDMRRLWKARKPGQNRLPLFRAG